MSDVPSNLIPTRITQLPDAPEATEEALLLVVIDGNSYKIRAADLLQVAGVPTSTQVIAGTGMTGGGALTGNVTLSIATGGVNSTLMNATGATPGNYGSSTQIPVFTVDSSGRITAVSSVAAVVSGYVPESRQVIAGNGLTGGGALNANVTLTANFASAVPSSANGTGSAGAANTVSRGDHRHPATDLADDTQVDGLLGLDNGGTNRSLTPAAGALVWCGADGLYVGPVGVAGQVPVSTGSGAYVWGSVVVQTDMPANVVFAGPASGPDAPTTFRALVNADLPNSGVTAASYGSGSLVPIITVNAKGVVTAVSTTGITSVPWSAITGTPTTRAGYGITDAAKNGANSDITSLAGLTTPLSVLQGGTGVTGSTGTVNVVLSNSPTLVSPILGTPQSGVATNLTGLPLTTGVTGTLGIANGGTGLTATPSNGQLDIGNGSGFTRTALTQGSGIAITNGAGSITIAATNAGTVTSVDVSGGSTGLTYSGGPIISSGTITMAGTLAATSGGTGQTSYAIGDLVYASTTTALSKLAAVATGNALISAGVGVAPVYGKIGLTTHVSGTLPVANGGTGLASTPTNGQIDIGNGTDFTRAALTQGSGITITNGVGSITIAGNSGTVTTASVVSANGFAGSVANASTTPAITITTTITGVLKGNGTAISAATAGTDYSAGTNALATGILKSTTTTGALSIATGADLPAMTATVGGAVPTPPNNTTTFLRGDGTFASPGGVGTVTSIDVSGGTTGLTTSGGPITASGTITLAGTLDADNGGTGQSSYAVGDLLYASTTTALSKLAAVATGNALISGGVGTAPSMGKIGLTTHVSGTLPIANGGTNSTATPTAGGVVYGDGSSHAVTSAGTAGQIFTSAGASAPTWSGISGGTF